MIPRAAGGAFGRALYYLDARTLRSWSDGGGLRALLSRWYARIFGFPELAAHRRFGPVTSMLERHGGARVLDLGAGNGLYSIADGIRRDGSAHLLADLSLSHMRRANATGQALGLAINGVACSAEALPLARGCIDTVLLIEVLQFVDDDVAAIREIARVLRPGGHWVCEQESPPAGSRLAANPESRLTKRRAGYTPDALGRSAAAVGLVLKESRMVSGPIGRWWEGVDGRLFQRSRTLYFLLFPWVKGLARLTTPAPVSGEPGTVLYVFQKEGR